MRITALNPVVQSINEVSFEGKKKNAKIAAETAAALMLLTTPLQEVDAQHHHHHRHTPQPRHHHHHHRPVPVYPVYPVYPNVNIRYGIVPGYYQVRPELMSAEDAINHYNDYANNVPGTTPNKRFFGGEVRGVRYYIYTSDKRYRSRPFYSEDSRDAAYFKYMNGGSFDYTDKMYRQIGQGLADFKDYSSH